jgi:hypothetical protein
MNAAVTVGQIYINGVPVTSSYSTTTLLRANGGGVTRIGSRADGVTQMSGQMQGLKFYSRILTEPT